MTTNEESGFDQAARLTRSRSRRAGAWRQNLGLLMVLVILIGIFSALSDSFWSPRTAMAIINGNADLIVVGVGMTFVLVVGGIDLSVGSILAFSSAVLGLLLVDYEWALIPAIGGAILAGSLCGLLNGLVIVKGGLPAFIVTLGMLEIARGGTYLITDSRTKYIGSTIEPLGVPFAGCPLSPAAIFALFSVAFAQLVLSKTVFGRYCRAIGCNEQAVRFSGIDPRGPRILVFVLSGLLCGVGGVMQTARLASSDPNAAIGLELAAIAAAVIGGTSLLGGRGSAVGTLLGVFIIAVLQTGLAKLGASEPTKRVITGGVIVLAVFLDAWRSQIGQYFQRITDRFLGRTTTV